MLFKTNKNINRNRSLLLLIKMFKDIEVNISDISLGNDNNLFIFFIKFCRPKLFVLKKRFDNIADPYFGFI